METNKGKVVVWNRWKPPEPEVGDYMLIVHPKQEQALKEFGTYYGCKFIKSKGEIQMQSATTELPVKRVEGTLYRLFEPRKAGRYKVVDFIVKTSQGLDLRCSSFKAIDSNLLGKVISFDANVTSYQGKEGFTVNRDSEITTLEGTSTGATAQIAPSQNAVSQEKVTVSDGTESKPTGRRGRPRRNETTSTQQAPASVTQGTPLVTSNPVVADLENVRSAAESIVTRDIEFLSHLVSPENLGAALQALQAIRATVFIESNKRASGRY